VGDPLADLSETLVREVVARHREWNRQRQWWLMLKTKLGDCDVPLGVCSIDQLLDLCEVHLGTKPDTRDRIALVRSLGEWILEEMRAMPAVDSELEEHESEVEPSMGE